MTRPTEISVSEEDLLAALQLRSMDYELIGRLRAEFSKRPNTSRAGYLRISPAKKIYIVRIETEEV